MKFANHVLPPEPRLWFFWTLRGQEPTLPANEEWDPARRSSLLFFLLLPIDSDRKWVVGRSRLDQRGVSRLDARRKQTAAQGTEQAPSFLEFQKCDLARLATFGLLGWPLEPFPQIHSTEGGLQGGRDSLHGAREEVRSGANGAEPEGPDHFQPRL